MVPFADGQLRRSGSLGAGVGGLTGFPREVDGGRSGLAAVASGGRDTMTHPRNTPASLSDLPSLAQHRPDGSGFGDALRRA